MVFVVRGMFTLLLSSLTKIMEHWRNPCQLSSQCPLTDPPQKAAGSRRCWWRYTRVQEIARGSKLQFGRFRS